MGALVMTSIKYVEKLTLTGIEPGQGPLGPESLALTIQPRRYLLGCVD